MPSHRPICVRRAWFFFLPAEYYPLGRVYCYDCNSFLQMTLCIVSADDNNRSVYVHCVHSCSVWRSAPHLVVERHRFVHSCQYRCVVFGYRLLSLPARRRWCFSLSHRRAALHGTNLPGERHMERPVSSVCGGDPWRNFTDTRTPTACTASVSGSSKTIPSEDEVNMYHQQSVRKRQWGEAYEYCNLRRV